MLLIVGFVMLLLAYFGPSAYRKAQMDKEVDRLCSIDGGVKVYERVSLPLDQFNQWGDPNIPFAENADATKAAYIVNIESRELIKGDSYGKGNPTLSRFHARVIRRSDNKTLGEAISYSRIGGDPDGPWHTSKYNGCSQGGDKNLKKAVFTKSG